jgi:phosphocarrier protein
MSSVTVEIVNKKGLHARAAAKFVKTASAYTAAVLVTKIGQNGAEDSPSVAGSSIIGLMMLGADPGSKLRIDSDGVQAQEVTAALQELVANRFGETE